MQDDLLNLFALPNALADIHIIHNNIFGMK